MVCYGGDGTTASGGSGGNNDNDGYETLPLRDLSFSSVYPNINMMPSSPDFFGNPYFFRGPPTTMRPRESPATPFALDLQTTGNKRNADTAAAPPPPPPPPPSPPPPSIIHHRASLIYLTYAQSHHVEMQIDKRARSPSTEDNLASSGKKLKVSKFPISKYNMNNRMNNNNFKSPGYWSPLQCVADAGNECDDMDDNQSTSIQSIPKIKVPPIKLLQKSCDYVHQMMKSIKVTDYCIKIISIGIKIMCESIDSYKMVIEKLKFENCQYFSHDLKSEKAFKVILYGLSSVDTAELKSELIRIGLKCVNIKSVTKNYEHYSETFYVCFLESGSIKMSDLKKNFRSVFHTQINWNYQRNHKNKITQCRNCQMFGHGENNYHVKTYCSICAGSHKTEECVNKDKFKCANCNESHKSTDLICQSRNKYLEIRAKIASKTRRSLKTKLTNPNVSVPFYLSINDFPSLPTRPSSKHIENNNNNRVSNSWVHTQHSPSSSSFPAAAAPSNIHQHISAPTINANITNSGELFSMEELNSLVMEMITKLSTCKTKNDQFYAIAQLATKFLYQNAI
ncbi:uncharacterized protein LOC129953890 [Eupeodes corollae]|uniref:uncharacterized protein LOC129953890 n=1 Tax=Eupeodes corollae TaxID=290404 RepID=UPI0024939AD6|nr:uncharacterized protein LOC129953890 [Eupeodes corollae]